MLNLFPTKATFTVMVSICQLRRCRSNGNPHNNFLIQGIFIDFSTGHLFGNSSQQLAPVALRDICSNGMRDISSKKPHQIALYFKKKFEFLKDKGWFDKLDSIEESLKNEASNHELAEELYQQLIQSSEHTGSTAKRYPVAIHPKLSK
jgi:hypothetical protein